MTDWKARAEKAEAACAEMRAALEKIEPWTPEEESPCCFEFPEALSAVKGLKHALSSDCGKGWVSPEYAEAQITDLMRRCGDDQRAVSPFAVSGGVFLDPFSGSGALPVAAARLGMDAYGIERNRDQKSTDGEACRWTRG